MFIQFKQKIMSRQYTFYNPVFKFEETSNKNKYSKLYYTD